MGRLVYTAIASLDGYVRDADGSFAWAEPTEEVHAFVNERERPVGTYLYGRGMYETMAVWETEPALAEASPVMAEYAELWRAADKVVYSTTLDSVTTGRTRLERTFDAGAVARLKEEAPSDLAVAGPTLAAEPFRAGLVDELQLYVVPVVVGGGLPALPDGVRLDLELLEERRFAGGFVFLRYAARR